MDTKEEGMKKLQSYFDAIMFPTWQVYDNLNRIHNYQFKAQILGDVPNWEDYIVVRFRLINADDYWIDNNYRLPDEAHKYLGRICASLTDFPTIASWY